MPGATGSTLEALLRRDRLVLLLGLAALLAGAWAYTVHLAEAMPGMGEGAMPGMADMPGMEDMAGMMDMPGMVMPMAQVWGAAEFGWLVGMWAVMMVAMMLPSAVPVLLLHSRLVRQRRTDASPVPQVALFGLGYFLVWSGFSVAAALAQWLLHRAALLTPMGASTSAVLGGGLLVAAGLYQWSPVKRACLQGCQSPLGFFTAHWRDGAGGAVRMGLRHGVTCVACCWLLMLLLFVLGVMNLLWVAALAIAALLERVGPQARWASRGIGVGAVVAGVWLMVR